MTKMIWCTIGLVIGLIAASCIIYEANFRDGSTPPVTPDDFNPAAKRYQLLKFSAPWCISCKLLDRELNKGATKRTLVAKRVELLPLDTDKDLQASEAWQVVEVPTIILVEVVPGKSSGKLVRRHVGTMSATELIKFVDADFDWIKK